MALREVRFPQMPKIAGTGAGTPIFSREPL
nr:MAG TPA: hypothetical protein [Caudoviricetes sp.]